MKSEGFTITLSLWERVELLNERSEFSNSGEGKPSGTTTPPPLKREVLVLIPPFSKGGRGGI